MLSRRTTIRSATLLLLALFPAALFAQAPAKTPDIVVFNNGEQLTGELEKANGGGITFKSTMAGEINVPWANIKTLTSSKSFAILKAKLKITARTAEATVPKGPIAFADKQITVSSPAGPQVVPVADANLLVDSAAFDKAVLHPPSFFQGWGGAATAGFSLVRATQNATSFNGGLNLVRATPTVDWLPARDRTLLGYTQSYGTTSQAGTATVKSDIFHGSLERDQYVSARIFLYGSGTFDHNFSQNLQLEQAYGGGVGITVFKSAVHELDFKGNAQYTHESFFMTPGGAAASPNVSLFGSTFSETYTRHLTKKGLIFNEFGSFTPAYNMPSDYSSHVQANLIFPVYKGLAFNMGFVDDFLNNAPVGSNKNSSQFTTGITYTIKPR